MKSVSKNEWEKTYSDLSFRHKNEYPSNEVIAFLMRRFGCIKDKSSIKGIDLGCGWGNNLKFLKDKGFDYSGVDFSPSAVKHCQKEHSNIHCCSLDNMPYANNSFDFAFDRMAAQHNDFSTVQKIFNEVYRILKPGGVFFSVTVEQANYDYLTTYLNKNELLTLSAEFKEVSVDYQEVSINNQSEILRSNILIAVK